MWSRSMASAGPSASSRPSEGGSHDGRNPRERTDPSKVVETVESEGLQSPGDAWPPAGGSRLEVANLFRH